MGALAWLVVGALLMLVLWLYMRFAGKKRQEQKRWKAYSELRSKDEELMSAERQERKEIEDAKSVEEQCEIYGSAVDAWNNQ